MAASTKTKRRAGRAAKEGIHAAELRDCTHHFRVPRRISDAMERAAAAERRTVSAWVAICVEDRLRGNGFIT